GPSAAGPRPAGSALPGFLADSPASEPVMVRSSPDGTSPPLRSACHAGRWYHWSMTAQSSLRTRTGSVAITGGYVVPVDGEPVDGGTVLVVDGVISAVGTDVTVPDGVPVLDATG